MITAEPQSEDLYPGATAVFTVTATGGGLNYLWYTNSGASGSTNGGVAMADGGNISGSATASLTISNVSAAYALNYVCVITNVNSGAYQSTNTSAATLTLATLNPAQVINFDVPGGVSGDVNYSGLGALTKSGDNYWNAVVTTSPYTTTNGLLSDGVTTSPITLTAPYGAGGGSIFTGDPQGANGTPTGLFAPFESDKTSTSETNTLNNVPAGTYNLYLYGNNGGVANSDRGTTFTVSSDLTPATNLSTVNLSADANTFVPGVNYVEFTNITVGTNGVIDIAWTANSAATNTFNPQAEGIFNGVQLVSLSSSAAVASITNSSPTNIQTTSASLVGSVLAMGGAVPSVTIYYGPSDGGTNAAAWSNSVALGFVTIGTFSQVVTNLFPGSTYYFTAAAVNNAGTAWATPSQSFTTVPVTLSVAQVFNVGTTNVQVVYSEPVEAASATNTANYVFTNGLAVTAASLNSDNMTVILTTAPLVYGSNYSVVINNVRDRPESLAR